MHGISIAVGDSMSPRKATLISNPKTGRYALRRRPVEALATQLESLGVKVDLRLTQGPGDATQIAARAARNGSSDVIVAGGDGTINEAIQGLAGTKARLAIIPRVWHQFKGQRSAPTEWRG